MADAVSREMILPALRLDVPPRPSERQLTAFAERSADDWTTSPRAWVTQQVVRLAVAEVLRSRLEQAGAAYERHPLPGAPETVTMGQLVAWFRPHVGLAGQAFQLGIVEAVNAGVPAAVDPLREGLRRLGVTGRDSLRMVALGLEKVPERARGEFWNGVRSSAALTAAVDALVAGTHTRDVSGLDRSHLSRADAIVLGGGRATAVSFGSRAREGQSWLDVPLRFAPAARRGAPEAARPAARPGATPSVEVGLRSGAWTEVFETALDAVGLAMHQLDTGNRPKGRGPGGPLTEALVQRLVAAKNRPVHEVVASLRAIDELALEMFDHQVTTASVRVAVPVVEDDAFMQLWLPTSALAGPLFTGTPDLFLGEGSDVRQTGGKPAGRPDGGRTAGRPGGAQQERRGQQPRQPRADARGDQKQPQQPRPEGKDPRGGRRGRGKKPAQQPSAAPAQPAPDATSPVETPAAEPPVVATASPSPEPSPTPSPSPTPEPSPTPSPSPTPEPSPMPSPSPSPTPEPSPMPSPSPTPEPSPMPSPSPTPEPSPAE